MPLRLRRSVILFGSSLFQLDATSDRAIVFRSPA